MSPDMNKMLPPHLTLYRRTGSSRRRRSPYDGSLTLHYIDGGLNHFMGSRCSGRALPQQDSVHWETVSDTKRSLMCFGLAAADAVERVNAATMEPPVPVRLLARHEQKGT